MPDNTAPPRSAYTQVMTQVYALFKSGMIQRFRQVLDRVESHLRGEARCIQDQRKKEIFVMAMEDIRERRQDLERTFITAMEAGIKAFDSGSDNGPSPNKTGVLALQSLSMLSLVDDSNMQDVIDIQSIVANTRREYEHLLVPIVSGLAQAYGKSDIDTRKQPLSPDSINDWLQQALTVLTLETVIRNAFYVLFQQEVFDTLATLYKQIIDVFQEQSIELAMQKARTRSYHIDTLLAQPVDLGGAGAAAKSSPGRQAHRARSDRGDYEWQTVETKTVETKNERTVQDERETLTENPIVKPSPSLWSVTKCLSQTSVPARICFPDGFESCQERSCSLAAVEENEPRTIIRMSVRQLDQVLSDIQLQMLREDVEWMEKLQHYLAARTNDHEVWVISPEHENLMYLINHSMNLIARSFHPMITKYLNPLRVSYARLAMTDNRFLDDCLHPAKSLLDALTCLCYGLNPNDKRILKQLFRCIRALYDLSVGESGSYEQLQHELYGFIESERQRTLEQERQTLQTLGKQKQRYLAFKTADAFIETRIRQLPHKLRFMSLLQIALRHVLAESYLNGGAQGDDWRATTLLFGSLIWTVQAKANEHDKHKLLRTLPQLLIALNNFFKKHAIQQEVQTLLAKQITEIQKSILAGRDGDSLTDQDLSYSDEIHQLVNAIRAASRDAYREKNVIGRDHSSAAPFVADARCEMPEQGQWLAYLVNHTPVFCKYAYHFSPLDKLVFVNWEGEKLFERDTKEVQADLSRGYAKPLEMPIPFESAMRYVCQQID
ncbi:MAG: DUF1631 family protein [Hahellaceae bacterium]|nr:DUF1631 family protein [Hahellaceae bacterium]